MKNVRKMSDWIILCPNGVEKVLGGGYIKKENKNQYHNRERGVYEKVSKNKHNVGGYVLNRF